MKRLALSALFHTRRVLIGSLLTLALLLLIARMLVPLADNLRGELVEHLGDFLGMKVEVAALTLRLDGWSPRLTLTGVRLSDRFAGQDQLSARELRLDLNLLATWKARRLRIEGLTLVGAEIEVRRTAEDRLELSGLQALGGGQDPGALAFFLHEGRFGLMDSRLFWTDSYLGAATVALDIRQFVVVNRDGIHQLRLQAELAGEPSSTVEVLARLQGPAERPRHWSGDLYVQAADLGALARLMQDRLPAGLRLSADESRLETWLALADGRVERLLGRFRALGLRGIRASESRPSAPEFVFGESSGLLQWTRKAASSELRLADVRVAGLGDQPLSLGVLIEPSQVLAAGVTTPTDQDAQGTGARRLVGAMTGIELENLRRLAFFLAPELEHKLPENLGAGPLDGRLEKLAFELMQPAAASPSLSWRVKGAVRDLGLVQRDGLPGVQGLDLDFDARPERGFARLSSRDGRLDLRPQLPTPTPVGALAAELGWRIEPAGSLRLQLPGLAFRNSDLAANLRASVCLHRSASPYADLQLSLRDADAAVLGRYLPVEILNEPLVAWLKRAVQGGRLTTGDLLLRGDLGHFPFDDQQGRFLIDLEIADGRLDFSAPRPGAAPKPRWPPLEDLQAEVRILNRRLDVRVERGRFLRSDVQQGVAVLPNLWRAERIFIAAEGQGPFSDGRQLLLDSPLEPQLGRLARVFEVNGALGVDLRLDVPFKRGDPVDYAGALHWQGESGATLKLGDDIEPMVFEGIQGDLEFGVQGIRARGLSAQLGDQSIRVDVATEEAGTERSRTRVDVRGTTAVERLADVLPNPWWGITRGSLDWQLELGLSNRNFSQAEAPIGLALTSDLRGLALRLPPPLGKPSQGPVAFEFQTAISAGRAREASLSLGALRAEVALAPGSGPLPVVSGAAIGFNHTPPSPVQDGRIRIAGRTARLDLAPWLDWWSAHAPLLRGGGRAMPLSADEIAVGRLTLGALALRDLSARLAPTSDGGIGLAFDAAENSGELQFPPAGSADPLQVRLERWQLTAAAGRETADSNAGRRPAQRAAADPRRVPAMALAVEHLEWDGQPLGRFRVDLVPNEAGVDFRELSLKGPLLDAQGQGQWMMRQGTAETAVDLELKSPDAGEFFRSIGLYEGLDRAPATVSAALEWPGDPGSFSLASAEGRLTFDVGPGRLLDVEPGVGRMLGILNLAAIQRRLSLDFSDVVDEGFSFDEAAGRFEISDGLARIQSFDLLSSTADIRIAGTTNLVAGTLNQRLTVTPKVGAGVALASAVAGGPLVGAAVFLADKVAGDAVDRLSRYQYRVTGPWGQPAFERLSGFGGGKGGADDGGSASSPPRAADDRPLSADAPTAARQAPGSERRPVPEAPEHRAESKDENLFLENF